MPMAPPEPSAELDLLTIGETMVLMLADGRLPVEVAGHYTRSIAGAETNVAIGVRRLGLRSAWISRLGNDPFGRAVRRTLLGEGVRVIAATDPERPTGLLIRDWPPSGPCRVQYYRSGSAATALSPADVDAAAVASARVLHLTGITAMLSENSCAALTTAQQAAHHAGRVVSFDPNIRMALGPPELWSERIVPLATASDIVLAGADELATVTAGAPDPVRFLLDAGVGVVVVKDGVRGSSAHTADGSVVAPARPVVAVDPVGAGDAFAAGFLARILAEHPDLRAGDVPALDALARALTTGSVVAARVVATATDIDGLPFTDDLDALSDGGGDVHR